jgi:methylphosphotriester-DNA--protein-cysteine methyltransferase
MTTHSLSGRQAQAGKYLQPSPALAEYVRRYEYFEADADHRVVQPVAVSVFPVLLFYLATRATAFEYAVRRARLVPPAIALGPCDRRVADVRYLGRLMNFVVVFEPTGFSRLFHLSPGELRNYAHDGRDVLGAWIRDLHSRLCEATRPEQMAEAVDEVLLRKSANALPKSPMQCAAASLLRYKARSNLVSLASSLGLSDSSWRRHFISEIGVTPKRYLRMLRFQHAVALKRASPDRTWTEVCLDTGYYDQAHLIADFHDIGRATPSRFMRELAGVPDAIATALYQPLADNYEVAVTGHSTNQAPQMFRSATRRGVRVPAGGL